MAAMADFNSQNNPLRVDWLQLLDHSVTGRLGRTFLPGKNHVGLSGMLHARSARADVARLRDEYGVDTLVLLNEDHEIAHYVDEVTPPIGPQDLRGELRAAGIKLLHFPIRDGGTPDAQPNDALSALLQEVILQLRDGATVAVACRGGHGRTGTILALLLIELGCTASEAIARVRQIMPECIDPGGQEGFVRAWRPTATL
jgi:ADP-ribosyl-[dinitrogen reductase] hydrolase